MSVEFVNDTITIDNIFIGFTSRGLLSFISNVGCSALSKQELAQLIAALQAMHDKMVDIEVK